MLTTGLYLGLVYLYFIFTVYLLYNVYKFLRTRFYLPGPKATGTEILIRAFKQSAKYMAMKLFLVSLLLSIPFLIICAITLFIGPKNVLGDLRLWGILIYFVFLPVVLTAVLILCVTFLHVKFTIRSLTLVCLLICLVFATIYLFTHLSQYQTIPSVLGLYGNFMVLPTILKLIIDSWKGERKVNRMDKMMYSGYKAKEDERED